MDTGLGRLHFPDQRDADYPLAEVLAEPDSFARTWRPDPHMPLNQGQTPRCVGYSGKQFLLTRPTDKGLTGTPSADDLYALAQKNDEFPGENYDGTTARGLCKGLQSLGIITEYRWAANVNEIITYLLTRGPVLIGSDWLEGMDNPDSNGMLTVTGKPRGGHEYLAIGAVPTIDAIMFCNSWGPTWGWGGYFFMKRMDLQHLVFNGTGTPGDAVAPIEHA